VATEIPYTLGDYFDVLRRRWIFIFTILPAGILIAVYLAFTLPTLYQASATLMVEGASIPEEMIKTTVTEHGGDALEVVQRKMMTADHLSGLIEEVDPYPDRPDLSARQKAQMISDNTEFERVDPITLEPLAKSDAFSVHYLNPDREIAREVTRRLAEMFLSYNRDTRTQAATDTYKFLKLQSDEASGRILEFERQLSDFKAKNGDALPGDRNRNEDALDRAERDLDAAQRQIFIVLEQKNTLELQLGQLSPNLFDPAGDWRKQLADLRAQLAEAQQKYTADHPTVRRLRRAIEDMSARTDLARPAPVAPDNPEYIQVASQLNTVKKELAVLEATAARMREQIDAYERGSQMAPEVEREYRQLSRDYDVAQERFRNIEKSLSEAALGQVLETEQRGAQLTLIRAATTPRKPYSPNRLGIILLGFVLGSGLAIGLAALVESADPTLRSARDLYEITDIRPLAAVPVMLNGKDRRRRFVAWGVASAVAAVAVLFVGSAVIAAI
jgi:polysaccharide chain length determinant protein (PEP-CTERM system associated)